MDQLTVLTILTILQVVSNLILHLQIRSSCCSMTPVGKNSESNKELSAQLREANDKLKMSQTILDGLSTSDDSV